MSTSDNIYIVYINIYFPLFPLRIPPPFPPQEKQCHIPYWEFSWLYQFHHPFHKKTKTNQTKIQTVLIKLKVTYCFPSQNEGVKWS